jgi:hypothetical protein
MPASTCRSAKTSALTISLLVVLASTLFRELPPMSHAQSQSPSQPKGRKQDQPFTVEYYYTAKWGYADEFIRLFKKNHYPVLKKQTETGRILQVTAVKPKYHATEDGRWDYKVTIVFKNLETAFAPSGDEETIKKQLYPDQETFRREEQRRFEILTAHWDVPIECVDLEQ